MTAADTPSESEEAPQEQSPDGPKKLREARDRALERVDVLEAEVRSMTFAQLGLDPDKGYGKAIATTYQGDYGQKGLDAIIEHAKDEYDLDLEVETPTETTTAKPDVSAGEERMKRLDNDSTPTEPDARQEALREAEDSGDINTLIAAGVSELRDRSE